MAASVGYFIEYIMMHGTINIKSSVILLVTDSAVELKSTLDR
jgi:hypothetical protein